MSVETYSTWDAYLEKVKSSVDYKESVNTDCIGVEVEGFLFIPDEISDSVSYPKREYKRTKIMSGGEFTSRSSYVPMEFSFNTTLELVNADPRSYDTVFYMMENKNGGCEVITPYKPSFKAEIGIVKTYPKASPNVVDVAVTVKEIPDVDANLYGDKSFTYPSITKLSDKAIVVKDVNTTTTSGNNEWKQQLKVEYDNPYYDKDINERYTNGY